MNGVKFLIHVESALVLSLSICELEHRESCSEQNDLPTSGFGVISTITRQIMRTHGECTICITSRPFKWALSAHVHTAVCVCMSLFALLVNFPWGTWGWWSLVRMSSWLEEPTGTDELTGDMFSLCLIDLNGWNMMMKRRSPPQHFHPLITLWWVYLCGLIPSQAEKDGGPGRQPRPVSYSFCDTIPSYWPLTQFCQRGSWRVTWTDWHSSAKTVEPTETLTLADGIQTCGIMN